MRGQEPISIEDFRGLFDRGESETCPLNFFTDCSNLEFTHKGFQTRGEFLLTYTFGAFVGNIIGLYLYPRLDGTSRRLILHRETATGTVRLYDIDHSAPPFLVATYTTDIDSVSTVQIFDRLYIAQLTTNNEHKNDAVIQVYDGISAARNAAGVAPAGATMTATEPGAGDVEAGIHLYAVVFETQSGYLTKPGPASWANFTSAGSKNVRLALIPVGPAGTVARHILATKVIPTYTDPQENFELFFVPGGKINDNITADLIINFFDTELVSSADYLLDLYETIPAGPLFTIGNSLGVAGFLNSATVGARSNADRRSIALISNPIDIEAFSQDEGYIIVKPSAGGVLTNGLDINGTLYLYKDGLTAVIQPSLDAPPIEWGSPGVVDSTTGTTPFGIARFMGEPFIVNNGAFIITKFGLQHFNGSYNNLSLNIEKRWTGISSFRNFKTAVAAVDPDKKRVFILIALGAASQYPDTFFVLDYKDGLTPEAVRWCPWAHSTINKRGFIVDEDGNLQACTASTLLALQPRVGSVTEVIASFAKTALLRFSNLGHVSNFESARIGARGTGALKVEWFSKDDVASDLTNPDLTMLAITDRLLRRLGNFSSPMASLKLSTVGTASNFMKVNIINVFGHIEAEEYPE